MRFSVAVATNFWATRDAAVLCLCVCSVCVCLRDDAQGRLLTSLPDACAVFIPSPLKMQSAA